MTKLHVAIELMPGDGKFRKYDTWQDQGQGGDAGFTRLHTGSTEDLTSLTVTPDDVKVIQTDSKYCPNTGESAGSRSHYANGKASYRSCKDAG